VLAVNQLTVGFREGNEARRDRTMLDESLMLTSDQNILDVRFTVQWRIADAAKFLFNVASPEITVKSVAEAAMRETIGLTPMQSIFQNRNTAEGRVKEAMQQLLDFYEAGITVDQVQFRAVEPPQQVIDAFRDVQAARADQEKRRNEAQKYQNTIVPQARGEAAKIVQDAEAYKQKAVTEAQGEAQRFNSILDQYRNAKQVTRERMYLETMQRVLGNTNKIVIENKSGIIQYLPMPMPELRRSQGADTTPQGGN